MNDYYDMIKSLIKESACDKVVNETYDTVERKGQWFIKKTIEYDCGLREVEVYFDIRKNLQSDLELAVEHEEYERAAELKQIIETL